MEYSLTTQRLGLRNWKSSDEQPFIEMCQDEAVMQYFPKVLSPDESVGLIRRLQNHFNKFGYCYFAVEVLETEEFIGFTGLANQTWESEFTPCVDMGWRLKRSAWGKGYATEAAIECDKAAFNKFGLESYYAFAAKGNVNSEKVMKKLNMSFVGNFVHPMLIGDSRYPYCFAYQKTKPS